MVWLVNSEDSLTEVETFLAGADLTLPCLLDTDGSWYRSYDRRSVDGSYAPYPLQVLLDQDGRIVYIAGQYDAADMNARIEALLAD